ncbi:MULTISPECIES: hypothetical protein [unclassified Yoonia]|uniref:hypothetical protein n=1 Tax=unclassified Yoonia TaxID=2629118 RepID=UPI002AFE2CDE|nr:MULTISPECIES: hypothetical protein [unclassified Yoonia]
MIGKIFFAWVSNDEAFNPSVHNREDEDVFSIRITEEEGHFATASVTLENPRVGLLSPARKQRVFISAEVGGDVQLLFAGRVVGVPANITGMTVDIEFIARPDDHAAVQSAFIETLKLLPNYHAAFVSDAERTDATAILESFPALLHWDRTTGALSLAAIANDGTQPVVDVADNFLEDSLDISFTSSPINSVIIDLEVSYSQTVPCISVPWFRDPDGGRGGVWGENLMSVDGLATFTPDDLVASWPRPGDTLDGGWRVLGAYLETDSQDMVSFSVSADIAPPRDAEFTGDTYAVDFFLNKMRGNLVVDGFYEQPRRETMLIEVISDLQGIVEFAAPEVISLSVEGADIAPSESAFLTQSYRAPQDDGNGYVTSFQTFTIPKAALARPILCNDLALSGPLLTAALWRARARLAKAARCITATFDVPFEVAASLSTASVCRIADPRIPGGAMTGKVEKLELEIDGSGRCIGMVQIGASIGRAVTATTPTVANIAADVPFEPAIVTRCRNIGPDDGTFAVASAQLRNDGDDQEDVLDETDIEDSLARYAELGYKWAQEPDDGSALEVLERSLQEVPTQLDAQFVSIEARDETITQITVTLSSNADVVRDMDLESAT